MSRSRWRPRLRAFMISINGTRAFIKYPRQELLERRALGMSRESVVLEISAAGELDAQIIKACRELKEAGFTVALENFPPWETTPGGVCRYHQAGIHRFRRPAQWLLIKKYPARG